MDSAYQNRKSATAVPTARGQASGWVTLSIVCTVQFLTPFMMSAVGVALPVLGGEFGASGVQLGLVETVFILAVSLFLLPCGRLGDIYGRRRVFVLGILLFTSATLAASLAGDVALFILFRFIQGTGAAMITGTSLAILSSVFPPEKRAKAMGAVVGCVYLGVSAGPVVGGFLITHLGWRWIFYAGAGAGSAAWLLTVLKLKGEWAEAAGTRFDTLGSFLYMGALFLLIVGVVNQAAGPRFLAMAALGIAGLALFFLYEYKKEDPLLDVRLLLSRRVFAFSNLATLINYAASFGLTFFFSLYLQVVKGVAPHTAGLILVSQPLLQAALSPVAGALATRVQTATLATTGMVICVAGLALASTVDGGTGFGRIVTVLAVMGVGFALFSTPNMLTVMGSVEPVHYGLASSLVSTMRTLGMLVSMTIATLVVSGHLGDKAVEQATRESFLLAMHDAFLVFAALSILGILLSMARMNSPAHCAVETPSA